MSLAKFDTKKLMRQGKRWMRSNSPEIKLIAGLTGVMISTVLFCKGAIKAENVKEVFEHDSSMIRNAQDCLAQEQAKPEEEQKPLSISFREGQAVHQYDMAECRREMGMTYRKAVIGFAKSYAVPTLIMVASIALIVSSHGELRAANTALNAALASAVASYDQLRTDVRNKFGPEVENELVNGITTQEVTHVEVDEDGKEVEKTELEQQWNGKLGKYSLLISKHPGAEWKHNPWTADQLCFELTANGLMKELEFAAIEDMVSFNDIAERFGHEKQKDWYDIVFQEREDGTDPIKYSIHTITDNTLGPGEMSPQYRKAYIIDIHVDESNVRHI